MGDERKRRMMGRNRMDFLCLSLLLFFLVGVISTGECRSSRGSSSRSSSRDPPPREQQKGSSSLTSSSTSRVTAGKLPSFSETKRRPLNSTRNARQTPEIPALYSAPKIPSPEIPALYSAPKINGESENDVDFSEQAKATTEITIGEDDEDSEGEDDFTEDTSEVYIKYGVPTERNLDLNESNQEEDSFNENPTESFPMATSRTNEIDQEDDVNSSTEDSYNSGYNNNESRAKEPSAQYGPPSSAPPPSSSRGGYSGPMSRGNEKPGQGGSRNNRRKSMRKMNSNNRRPTDQQQNENNLESVTQKIVVEIHDLIKMEVSSPPPVQLCAQGDVSSPPPESGVLSSAEVRLSNSPPVKACVCLRQFSQTCGWRIGLLTFYGRRVGQSYFGGGQDTRLGRRAGHIPLGAELDWRRAMSTSDDEMEEPEAQYLPPVHQPPKQPKRQKAAEKPPQPFEQDQMSEQTSEDNSSYGPNQYEDEQPPNPNYRTLPLDGGNDDGVSDESSTRQATQTHPQDLSQQRSGDFPPQRHPNQNQQRQNFGRENGPSVMYGPPGVNHFHGANPQDDEEEEDELEGLDEKIVDAELFHRVQQIIEDHERQQKELLDSIQKHNENDFPSHYSNGASGYSPSSSSQFNGNQLSDDRNGGYSGDFHRKGEGDSSSSSRTSSSPYPQYGPPQIPTLSSTPTDFSNGYQNSGPFQTNGNSQNFPQNAGNRVSPAENNEQPGSHNNTQDESEEVEVEYQKAILSTHFTETEPDPEYQLNSVAGPGPEYLPPQPAKGTGNSGGGSREDDDENALYSNSFAPESQHGSQDQNSYGVKLSTGIRVVGDRDKPSSPSPKYGPPAKISSPTSSLSDEPREFHASQDGSGLPGVFNAEMDGYPAQLSPQNKVGKSLITSSESGSGFWSRNQDTPQPHTRYGPPSPPPPSSSSSQQTFQLGLNGVRSNAPTMGAAGTGNSNEIEYSNEVNNIAPDGDNFKLNNDNFQRSYNFQQQTSYLPPIQQPQQQQPQNPPQPRPVYGVPLAPVISLDSNNNLPAFNDPTDRDREGGLPMQSYSQGAIKSSTYSNQNHAAAAPQPNPNYLPPQHYYSPGSPSSSSSSPTPGTGQDSHSLLSQAVPFSYGMILDNNPPSAPSTSSQYLEPQGQNGISDGFALPIYDYSPPPSRLDSQEELLRAGAATSPVVLPLEQFLQQYPTTSFSNIGTLSPPENLPAFIYGGSRGTYRVSRRAISKQATISPGLIRSQ